MPKEFVLTEHDLEALFTEKKVPTSSPLKRIFRYVFSFILIFLMIFTAANYQSLIQNFNFWYKTEYKAEPFVKNSRQTTKKQDTTAAATAIVQTTPADENHILIESIGVDAPITWRVENTENDVRQALQKGVIHINGTSLPGQQGNVFITGHSSDLAWSRGSYKTVFALLNKLVIGDIVKLRYQNTEYTYKITATKIVEPTDTSVMNPTKEPTLTLVTCTPVGTSLRRLVLSAKQVSPDPARNTGTPNATTPQKMPTAR